MFSLAEMAKGRRRLLFDTLSVNYTLPEPANPNFKDIAQVTASVFQGTAAVAFDFRCYYFQMALDPEVSKYYCVRLGSRVFRFTRLPMGAKMSVTVAQTLTNHLVSLCVGEDVLFCDTYIDNVLFVCRDMSAVDRIREKFRQICVRYRVTIGSEQAGSRVEHRGLVLDYAERRVRLKESFIEKVCAAEIPSTMTLRQLQKIVGRAVYAAAVMDQSLASLFHTFKFLARYRNRSGRLRLWNAVLDELRHVRQWVSRNEWVRPRVGGAPGPILVTDAEGTNGVLGWVIVRPTSAHVLVGSAVEPLDHIAVLEARAVLRALDHAKRWMRETISTLLCDNTTVLSTLYKGHARNFRLNVTVSRIQAVLQDVKAQLVLLFVPSSYNPADAVTRHQDFSPTHSHVLDWMTQNALRPSAWMDFVSKQDFYLKC